MVEASNNIDGWSNRQVVCKQLDSICMTCCNMQMELDAMSLRREAQMTIDPISLNRFLFIVRFVKVDFFFLLFFFSFLVTKESDTNKKDYLKLGKCVSCSPKIVLIFMYSQSSKIKWANFRVCTDKYRLQNGFKWLTKE